MVERIEESEMALLKGGGYWLHVAEDVWIYIDDEDAVADDAVSW